MKDIFDNQIMNKAYTCTLENIRKETQKITVLHEKFKKRTKIRSNATKHEIIFGMFVTEYVQNLKNLSIDTDIDNIFLQARRLLEVWITIKYINQSNLFYQIPNFCARDRIEYLEGWKARDIADLELFSELKKIREIYPKIQSEIDILKKDFPGKLPKLPSVSEMAKKLNLQNEYTYFYKLTSKILHFCPFSLNNEHIFEKPLDKLVFLMRILKYRVHIREEIEKIFHKTKLKNT